MDTVTVWPGLMKSLSTLSIGLVNGSADTRGAKYKVVSKNTASSAVTCLALGFFSLTNNLFDMCDCMLILLSVEPALYYVGIIRLSTANMCEDRSIVLFHQTDTIWQENK
jgi:hypothetical protein